MDITCIADLHGHYPELEGGDLLIVAGDLTLTDTFYAHAEFQGWMNLQKYKKKIFIAGNHDNNIDDRFEWDESFQYLCDSGTEFEYWEPGKPPLDRASFKRTLKIWGTPWTLAFDGMNPHCTAFTGTEETLAAKFAMIPEDTDILISHGPPYGILDQNLFGENCGSMQLGMAAAKIKSLKLWVFGHIHEEYGQIQSRSGYKLINCSHVNEHYQPVNKPIRVII